MLGRIMRHLNSFDLIMYTVYTVFHNFVVICAYICIYSVAITGAYVLYS